MSVINHRGKMDLAKWFSFKKNNKENAAPGRAAISLQQDGIALAYCLFDDNQQPCIQFCEFYPDGSNAATDQLTWLIDIVTSRGLNGVTCSWILDPTDYKLLMLDAPDVPEKERNAAVRWQIKELINFPLEEAVIDTCLIPEFGSEHRHMLYAAIAQESKLARRLQLLRKSGLLLDAIDIVELALRNLTRLFVEQNDSVLLLSLMPDYSKLAVYQAGNLYFARQLQINLQTISDDFISLQSETGTVPDAFDELVTDIQRSLDFFENQMVQPSLSSIVIMPLSFRANTLKTYLNDNLSPNVVIADLNDVFNSKQELMWEVQAQCVSVLGGLLR